MSIRKLPQASMPARPKNFQWDAPSDALGRWAELPLAASDGGDANTIEIYEVIGEDWWSGGGFTDRKMAAALRAAGNADVTVNINSPGGDMFEGIAIYNMLAAHPGKVTVNVMGLAASAASVIAMSVPFFFKRMGADPAVAAGPLALTFIDFVGSTNYLVIAYFMFHAH